MPTNWKEGIKATFLHESGLKIKCMFKTCQVQALADILQTDLENWLPLKWSQCLPDHRCHPVLFLLVSGYNLSQLFMAANPQGSAYFHSPLHHFKCDPLSLDSKHVLVSSLGFGPPHSNPILLLLVVCPGGRQEQENRDKMSKMKCEKDICVHS